jgi:hypothetical protein
MVQPSFRPSCNGYAIRDGRGYGPAPLLPARNECAAPSPCSAIDQHHARDTAVSRASPWQSRGMAFGTPVAMHRSADPTLDLLATPPTRVRDPLSYSCGWRFFLLTKSPHGSRHAMSARSRVVVVGNGMVGQRLLEALSPAPAFSITVIAEEPRPAYDRVQLSAFFCGKTAADLSLAPPISSSAMPLRRIWRNALRPSIGRPASYELRVAERSNTTR